MLATILQQLPTSWNTKAPPLRSSTATELVIVGAEGISERYLGLRMPVTEDSAAVQVLRLGHR